MPLPKEGTSEWIKELGFYKSATQAMIDKRAKILGIKPGSYRREMHNRGVTKGNLNDRTLDDRLTPGEDKGSPIIVNLPPIVLKDFVAKEDKESEEIAILHMSDGHAGKITRTFNDEVYNKRMENVFESTMDIVTKHRKMYKINKLWLPNCGDNVQGENVHQGSKVGSISMGARDQTSKIAFPAWAKLIGSLKQEFEEIIFDGVCGNHGHSKETPETSAEDLRLYDLLQAYFFSTKGITFRIHEPDFSEENNIVTISGFRFFIFHGDGINSRQGVPFMALNTKLKSWHMQFHGFNYALGGHFHKRAVDEISSSCTYAMCGSLVSDDDWAVKRLGVSSIPSQNIFGLHHRRGFTWNYQICVDDEFIPEKIIRPDKKL